MKRTTATMFAIATTLATEPAFAQTNVDFTSVAVAIDGSIRISWNSRTNEVYQIKYTDQLVDGGTVWKELYEDYPSHGTNTFWLDAGNYFFQPPVLHPSKTPMRFYRIYLSGTNTAPAPTISITSPTDGATVSGNLTVTVNASSDLPILRTILYVDGQEMPASIDGTNFVINTCEWANGSHVLFAIAKAQSTYAGRPNQCSFPTRSRAVSAYINLTFDNLITQFSFSEPFFEPALGHTQRVSASFAANVDWVLEIQNANHHDVLYVTGSGGNMQYPWDGTGTNHANLPNGVYTYLLTAHTNGQALPAPPPSGGGGEGGPPSPLGNSMVQTTDELGNEVSVPTTPEAAITAGLDSYFVLPPPMPPVKVNGVVLPWEEVFGPEPLIQRQVPLRLRQQLSQALPADATTDTRSPSSEWGGGAALMDAGTPTSQATQGPVKPPNVGVKAPVGTFGIGYQNYNAPGGTFTTPPIRRVPQLPQYIGLDGLPAGTTETWGNIPEFPQLGNGFYVAMQNGGYKAQVVKVNDAFSGADLTGGSFNTVNIALVGTHCSYATDPEVDGVYHTYPRFYNLASHTTSYIRHADCNFGGPGTNGLKWIGLLACNALRNQNYNSMYNNLVLPINNGLHLLLSTSTFATAAPEIGYRWGSNMLAGVTVLQSWFNAGSAAYLAETNHLVITFRGAGWPAAFADHITDTGTTPGTGNESDITKQDSTVYNRP